MTRAVARRRPARLGRGPRRDARRSPAPAHRLPLVPRQARGGTGGLRGRPPAWCHSTSTSTPTWSPRPVRDVIPSPTRSCSATGWPALGIGDEHLVVAYDDLGGWVATRLWWMLDDLGHRAVAVLDGGVQAWVESGRTLTTDVVAWPPATLTLADRWTRVIDRDGLRASLGSIVLLDARAAPRYRGEIEPIDAVAGHIPTARNAPTDGNLGPDGRFLPPAALRERFEGLGVADLMPTSSPRAAAAYRRPITRSRCASPACPTRGSTPAHTAIGPSPASRSPPAPTPATRRSEATRASGRGPARPPAAPRLTRRDPPIRRSYAPPPMLHAGQSHTPHR